MVVWKIQETENGVTCSVNIVANIVQAKRKIENVAQATLLIEESLGKYKRAIAIANAKHIKQSQETHLKTS